MTGGDFLPLEPVGLRPALDADARNAAHVFLRRLPSGFRVARALVFGSRARGEHGDESDTDLAVILSGPPGDRWSVSREMARLAFDVMMETGVLIDPLAVWEVELTRPEHFINPGLIRAILRDGVQV